jgi:hypothetical protein
MMAVGAQPEGAIAMRVVSLRCTSGIERTMTRKRRCDLCAASPSGGNMAMTAGSNVVAYLGSASLFHTFAAGPTLQFAASSGPRRAKGNQLTL